MGVTKDIASTTAVTPTLQLPPGWLSKADRTHPNSAVLKETTGFVEIPPYEAAHIAVRLAPEPMDPLKGSSNSSRDCPMPNRGSSRDILRALSNVLYDCLQWTKLFFSRHNDTPKINSRKCCMTTVLQTNKCWANHFFSKHNDTQKIKLSKSFVRLPAANERMLTSLLTFPKQRRTQKKKNPSKKLYCSTACNE